jgi:phosphate transport system substrate-binding protein
MRGGTGMTMRLALAALALAVAGVAAACGGQASDGAISADGSSTVGPFMEVASERFQAENDVEIDVSISESGHGLDRFCAGDVDIANASRPIDEDEAGACGEAGVDYVELQVASDALTVAIHRPILYDWVTCLTVEQLRKIWRPDSQVNNWNEVDPSFPDVPLRLYGADHDSGTFRYFTFVINGERGASRTDYAATEDDNDSVEGIADDKGALGYFGFSYYQQNRDRLSALEIAGGNGCVAPSVETVHNGSYQPLARPLFIYVNQSSLDRSRPLRSFVRYVLENAEAIADEALFVPLSKEQVDAQMREFVEAIS